MSTKLLPLFMTVSLCLSSIQSPAQMVTDGLKPSRPRSSSPSPRESFDLAALVQNSDRPWEKSKYFKSDRQAGLKEISAQIKDRLASPPIQKGGMDGGGGGNVLIAVEDGLIKTWTHDLYEAQAEGLTVNLGPGNFLEKISFVLERFSKVAPVHAKVALAMARDLLLKDSRWVVNAEMPVIRDINISVLPRGALIVQSAIQRPLSQKNFPNTKTYIFDKDIFNLLDEDSKAGLILHEVFYRQTRFNNFEDSDFARTLTGLIVSEEISNYNSASFNKVLYANRFGCLEAKYVPSYSISFTKEYSTTNGSCGYFGNIRFDGWSAKSNLLKIFVSGALTSDPESNSNRIQFKASPESELKIEAYQPGLRIAVAGGQEGRNLILNGFSGYGDQAPNGYDSLTVELKAKNSEQKIGAIQSDLLDVASNDFAVDFNVYGNSLRTIITVNSADVIALKKIKPKTEEARKALDSIMMSENRVVFDISNGRFSSISTPSGPFKIGVEWVRFDSTYLEKHFDQ
jgi:hypothetical protein